MVIRRVDYTGSVENCDVTKDEGGELKPMDTESQKRHWIDGTSSTRGDDLDGEAEVHVITDLDVYEGNTLGEKIDSLIASEPVVMINRTWCLFSVDAQNFLVYQMNVSVHSIEVDTHPQGKDILSYVYEKHKHKTTPVIFFKGEFVGGFEEVNALYAQGTLEEQYLEGLSHADRCEAFITKAKLDLKPYFWFPEKVNANVVRITGILTCLISAAAAVLVHYEQFFWGRYIAYGIFFDFVLRLLGGAGVSLVGRIGMLLVSQMPPKPRLGRPKQFATICGIIFSGLGSLFYVWQFPHHDIVGSVFMGGLAIATGMEGFLDFCVGCVFFRIGVELGLLGTFGREANEAASQNEKKKKKEGKYYKK